MNTKQIKSYAPEARRDFIAAVTDRAALYGLTAADEAVPVTLEGDVAIIGGKAFPKADVNKRARLADRIRRDGFEQVMEAVAYTWFNRLMAIRYMELHGYLEHGYRVLSHPEGKATPEILEHATEVELPGVAPAEVVELKLAGNRDEELYRLLLLGQCHALHKAMPFLFEDLDDETELLLTERLLHTDSLVRRLVESIEESAWGSIEIVGWLYQFYVSEKKDQVIGKMVKSEDIPAATQLFTPNWIVKYLVQNSLGAQWLATYPNSPLKGQMEYYIEPAEQTGKVKVQLEAITPSTLNPEELTLIDPASGSGHILVEAYELFKAMYLEHGYRQRDVAQLILENNLFGLDIDERAAQLTGFALMMKGRADDQRLFERGVKLNVMALVDSAGFDREGLVKGVELPDYALLPSDLTELKRLFEHATTFGSLIQVPEELARKLPALKQLSEATSQDLFVSEALERLGPLVQQAKLLTAQYDNVVANPPYMGGGSMNALVKKFAQDKFPDAKSDLFACFIERSYTMAKVSGHNAMVTMQSWMFLSSFQTMRERMLRERTITTMTQIGYNSFPSLNSKVAQATAFSLINHRREDFVGTFVDLNSAPQSASKEEVFLARDPANRFTVSASEFKKLPGSPVAYWASPSVRDAFRSGSPLGEIATVCNGIKTGNVEMFIRRWFEVSRKRIGFGYPNQDSAEESGMEWFPYSKGGEYRKWYGNNECVLHWQDNGGVIGRYSPNNATPNSRIRPENRPFFFTPGVTWSSVSPSFGARFLDEGFLFDIAGPTLFPKQESLLSITGLLTSKVAALLLKTLNETINILVQDIRTLPFIRPSSSSLDGCSTVEDLVTAGISIGRGDWHSFEISWDFQSLPVLKDSSEPDTTLESSYTSWIIQNRDTIAEMKRLEEENNRLFIDAYGLADELTSDVPIEQITLTVNPAYRYGGKLTEEEQWSRFRQDTMKELVSYAIGCMMGRYSLDEPGLVYAHSGNEGFDPARYATFPADDDGVIPLTSFAWFADDATHRLVEFISVAWDKAHLDENLAFLAQNLSPKRGEDSRDTLRRYLATKFFKDHHLKTYKKRPIYWPFSSGKQRAFQALVYLHRYHEGTLGRMRTEYVIPLQGKIASRIQQLEGDAAAATSTPRRKKLEKERDTLLKQRVELQDFDEKLRHYADQRIHLDLDDGVKVNYGRFGDLLAEVKAVTGKKPA